jgi:hypothetical protein
MVFQNVKVSVLLGRRNFYEILVGLRWRVYFCLEIEVYVVENVNKNFHKNFHKKFDKISMKNVDENVNVNFDENFDENFVENVDQSVRERPHIYWTHVCR